MHDVFRILAGANEPIGEPEAVPGLDGTRIGRCERPAVFVNDKLIQTARGLVTKPA